MPAHARRSRAGRAFHGDRVGKAPPCAVASSSAQYSPAPQQQLRYEALSGGSCERGAALCLRELLTCQASFAWSLSLARQLVDRSDAELLTTLSKTYSQARDAFHKVASLTMAYAEVLLQVNGRVLPALFEAMQQQDFVTSLSLSRLLLSWFVKMRKDGEMVQDDIVLVRKIVGNAIVCGELSLEFGLLEEDDMKQKTNLGGADARHSSIPLLKMAIHQLEEAQDTLQERNGFLSRLQSTLRMLAQEEHTLRQLVSKLDAAALVNNFGESLWAEDARELATVSKALSNRYWLGGKADHAKCAELFENVYCAMDDIAALTNGQRG